MKVAIVNDSRMAAEILRRVLATLSEFTLIWTAYSGEEAIKLCADTRPDIVLMDLIMPGMDGAETTRRIMQSTPCVILIVTATTIGNRDAVFEAMGHGALDAVNTPVLGPGENMTGADPLIQKLRMVARIADLRRKSQAPKHRHHEAHATGEAAYPVVALGASTGGPQALAAVLSQLPAHFPAAVLVSQHVDEEFTPGLAKWLQHHCPLPVSVARESEMLKPGSVWIAATSKNLTFDNGRARYMPAPADAPLASVDMLFLSLARPHKAVRVGALLTGMGRDGAEGLLAMRKAGALTIAQDEATSVVYGMPKAAVDLKAAMETLPLDAIGPRICDAVFNGVRAQSAPAQKSSPVRRKEGPSKAASIT